MSTTVQRRRVTDRRDPMRQVLQYRLDKARIAAAVAETEVRAAEEALARYEKRDAQ